MDSKIELIFLARSLRQEENIIFVHMIKLPKGILLCCAFFATSAAISQELTVRDRVSQQSIPNAKVYSIEPKVQRLADVDGRFQLDDFKNCDTIYVSYQGFGTGIFQYEELKKTGRVELSDSPLSISEMTVTASRWEQDKVKVPGRINKLNLREAEQLGPQTAADLLETSGYVYVQKSQLAGGSPQLRGFGTNRVMIVVDGVRMNNAIFRAGNLQNVISLDANSLESTEVLFGPGAVMYGSDAIGGVMNFRTKEARFSPDSTMLVKSSVFGRYSSSSNEVTGHFDINFGKKKWAFLTAASFSRFGDLMAGEFGDSAFLRPTFQQRFNGVDSTVSNAGNERLQVHSGYGQLNALQKIRFRPSENWEFDLSVNYSTTSDAPRYDRLILDKQGDGILDNAEWYYGPQQFFMSKFGLSNHKKNTFYNELRLTAAYQNYQESRHDRKTGSSSLRNRFEKVNAFSLNVDADKEIGDRLSLFYGIEGIFNHVGSNGYRENINTLERTTINSRYPNGSTWQSYGMYFNAKYDLSDKWNLNGGVRYSYYRIQADFDTSLFAFPVESTINQNGALNGSLGLVFNPNNHFQFYLNGSTGFRAPNIDDLGKVFDSEPGSVVVPNVDLKPEFAYNGEAGFVWVVAKKVKLDAAVYYTYLQNALARADFQFNGQDSIVYDGQLSRVQAIQNASDASVYGVQGGIEVAITKGLTFRSMISFQKGQEYSVDSSAYFPKSHVAPTFGRTSLIYKTRQVAVNAYAVYHGRMNANDLPLSERSDFVYAKDANGNNYTPSWYTLNLKATYFFNKHISLTGGVENITNQLYRTFGSGISASGRNYVISLKGTF